MIESSAAVQSDREVSYDARTIPVQQRGADRVDKLLDAAAAIIDEVGVAALTTSAVAERSGSSVGVVYRYFPNAGVLVLALADRNRVRYAAELDARLREGEPTDWRAYVRTCIEAYASMARAEPGFATVRFGDVVAMRLNSRNATLNDELGRSLLRQVVDRFGFRETEELDFMTTVAMETADAMIRRAFQADRDGDERFIEIAYLLVTDMLAEHAPVDGTA